MSNARSDGITLGTSPDAVIAVGGRDWPVRLLRHPNTRRYRLALDPVRGELRLSLPKRASASIALRWAGEQHDWIAAQAEKMHPPVVVRIGSVLPYAGDGLRLSWAADAPRKAQRIGDTLLFGGPADAVPRRAERWLRAEALRIMAEESADYAARIGRDVASVSVADQRRRWGSCSSDGQLRYNWRLIMAPPFVRRSTVAHEVAHLVHMHHGPAFHALADELFEGDPAEARAWLRTHGSALHRYRFG